ncbi:hypothetical protein DK45_4260 [Bordetella bronchiseptica]|nr:hypothetical protein DK45_4260 [Bordetella bronchiseptica]
MMFKFIQEIHKRTDHDIPAERLHCASARLADLASPVCQAGTFLQRS